MYSSAFGATARMVRRSFSRAARCSAFTPARYSSMDLGLPAELFFLLVIVFPPSALFLLRRLLQFFDVEFHHFEHGLHDALRFRGVLAAQQLAQNGGHDLPGKNKFVFQPTA